MLYGMRRAASGWEYDCARELVSVEMQSGANSVQAWGRRESGCARRLRVHWNGSQNEPVAQMRAWYDVNVRGALGCARRDQRYTGVMDRMLRWTDDGLKYEADKHRQALLEARGLSEESNMVSSWRNKRSRPKDDATLLDARSVTKFVKLAATLNYMSMDRSDVQYAAKEMCTKMARPSQ